MSTFNSTFDSYQIRYCSGISYEAIIYLFKEKDNVARLFFYDNDAGLPQNQIDPYPAINFTLDRFRDVLDVLQTEKPLKISINDVLKSGVISSADFEPVGEEEGV